MLLCSLTMWTKYLRGTVEKVRLSSVCLSASPLSACLPLLCLPLLCPPGCLSSVCLSSVCLSFACLSSPSQSLPPSRNLIYPLVILSTLITFIILMTVMALTTV
jgi:hypothetical protein